MKYFILLWPLFFLTVSCQHQPTKVVSQEPVLADGLTAEKLLKGRPVILDARSPFEFNLAHVPGAINVRWEDFSQANPKSRGLLQNDLFAIARRLALIGVDPDTRVLVLGKGPQGGGEEGRVAWTLKVLGIKEVYTLLHTSYREMNTVKEVPPVQNKSYWKPEVVESLTISLPEFKKAVTATTAEAVVIDVRAPEEFALRNFSKVKDVKAKVLNIPWQEFFDEKGLPRKNLESFLATQGLDKKTQIFFVSNHGVRSGAATYALFVAGFGRVRNFSGGYEIWK